MKDEERERNAELIKALEAGEKVVTGFLAAFGWTLIFCATILCPLIAWTTVLGGATFRDAGIAFGVFGVMVFSIGLWALLAIRGSE